MHTDTIWYKGSVTRNKMRLVALRNFLTAVESLGSSG